MNNAIMRSTNKRSAAARPTWKVAAAVKTGSRTLVYWEATVHSDQEMVRLKSEGYIGDTVPVTDDLFVAIWDPILYLNTELEREQLPSPEEGGADGDLYIAHGPREKRGANNYVVTQLYPEEMDENEWAACDRKDQGSIIFKYSNMIIVDWKPVWILENSIERL